MREHGVTQLRCRHSCDCIIWANSRSMYPAPSTGSCVGTASNLWMVSLVRGVIFLQFCFPKDIASVLPPFPLPMTMALYLRGSLMRSSGLLGQSARLAGDNAPWRVFDRLV